MRRRDWCKQACWAVPELPLGEETPRRLSPKCRVGDSKGQITGLGRRSRSQAWGGASKRFLVHLSLVRTENYRRHGRLYRSFKDLKRRFRNLPWLPTLLFSSSSSQEILSYLQPQMCMRYCFGRSSRPRPLPQHVYSSDGMEPITGFSFNCRGLEILLEQSIGSPRWNRAEGRLGAWGMALMSIKQVMDTTSGHFVYLLN